MRKYLGSILLCLFLLSPSGLSAQDKSNITNSIYFGGEYFFGFQNYGGGGYLGFETNFGNPAVSLVNNFGLGYIIVDDFNISNSPEINIIHAISMYYSLGLRVYLGHPYIFMDFNAGVGGYLSTPYQEGNNYISWLASILLGFNIPLSETTKIQFSVDASMLGKKIFGFNFRVGLQFKL